MTILEKVSYLKGLSEGLGLDDNNKQDKLIKAIIEVLGEVAINIEDLEISVEDLSDQVDAVDSDLAQLEDDFDDEYDEYDDEDGCASGCSCGHSHDDDEDDDDEFYEVECPACSDIVYIDEDMLDDGSIDCPNCGTVLEFDFDCGCEVDETEENKE